MGAFPKAQALALDAGSCWPRAECATEIAAALRCNTNTVRPASGEGGLCGGAWTGCTMEPRPATAPATRREDTSSAGDRQDARGEAEQRRATGRPAPWR